MSYLYTAKANKDLVRLMTKLGRDNPTLSNADLRKLARKKLRSKRR